MWGKYIKMKFNKKDVLILIIPVIIMLLIMPVLPDKISIHRGISGSRTYIDKKYSFLLGLIPFVAYKLKYDK
ncbi:MAG: hypothetical protein K0R54_1372 [Clostridiaceae bacterium]|jgi:uncharacterized membrane protein|nr:hypothetical protein [Clostridiaceae bacterium]